MVFTEVLLALVATLVGIYYYAMATADYWKKRGVPFAEPTPLVGNIGPLLLNQEYRGFLGRRFYRRAKFNGHRFLGMFLGRRPALLIADLDLVKSILIKDFQYFEDRGLYFNVKREPLSANLFNLSADQGWRVMRSKLTPTFTSGKMRSMFYLINECAGGLEDLLAQEVSSSPAVDVSEVLARFYTDIIGSCAFGVEANSLKDPEADFRVMGRLAFSSGILKSFLRLLAEVSPRVRQHLPIRSIRTDVEAFFTKMLNENIAFREKQNIERHDFLDLLIQLKNKGSVTPEGGEAADAKDGKGKADSGGVDMEKLPAQAFVFFLAGFETSAGASSSCLIELSQNTDVQDKLRLEIHRTLAKHGGKITYDALQEMTYMDQVLEETMRLYPAVPLLPRVVTRRYQVPDSKLVLEVGTRVLIPVYAIHTDPDIYPSPSRFDPDRFSEETKRTRPYYAYLPFGEGPRICIGLRFAMLQMKTALVTILRAYSVLPAEKTDYPIVFDPKSFVTKSTRKYVIRLVPL